DAAPGSLPWIGPFVFGTDGQGMENLVVTTGGMRRPEKCPGPVEPEQTGEKVRFPDHLYMNGPEIFAFTLRAVPQAVQELLARVGRTIDDIDLFVFHQANRYMLEHLRDKLKIPPEKFVLA